MHCWAAQSTPELPTRVIEIGPTVEDCRLYESAGQHEHYVTLSHCWGRLEILTTTKQNLEEHKKHIDLKSLPQTFQDAISVTLHLGIRYLWIDSLCIVQNDPDDWAQESSKMGYIYHNSYLTIAATAAKDGSEGLFKRRDVDTLCINIPEPNSAGKSTTLRARRSRKHLCVQSVAQNGPLLGDPDPLIERAWVYQERLLSRRLLHFASDEMIWECRQTSECECGILKRKSSKQAFLERVDKAIGLKPDRSMFEEVAYGRDCGTEGETQRWYQLVKTYTSLKITKDEDRLPAFSGIAGAIVDSQDYVAGIRKNHAVRDLLWMTRANARRSRSYLAPTWSWASLLGDIIHKTALAVHDGFDESRSEVLIEISDISAMRSTADPFGKVKEGELRVRGYCLKAKLIEKDPEDLIGSSWGSHRLRLEIPSASDTEWLLSCSLDTADDAQMIAGSSVSLLAVISINLSHVDVCHLILVEHFSSPRVFRRIGVASVILFSNALKDVELGRKPTYTSTQDFLDRSQAQFIDIVII